jgi:hypothetical protein
VMCLLQAGVMPRRPRPLSGVILSEAKDRLGPWPFRAAAPRHDTPSGERFCLRCGTAALGCGERFLASLHAAQNDPGCDRDERARTRPVGNEPEWPEQRRRLLKMGSVKKQVISSGRRRWAARSASLRAGSAEKPGPEVRPAAKSRSRPSAARFLGFARPETGSARNDGVVRPNSVMPSWGGTSAGTAPFRQAALAVIGSSRYVTGNQGPRPQ